MSVRRNCGRVGGWVSEWVNEWLGERVSEKFNWPPTLKKEAFLIAWDSFNVDPQRTTPGDEQTYPSMVGHDSSHCKTFVSANMLTAAHHNSQPSLTNNNNVIIPHHVTLSSSIFIARSPGQYEDRGVTYCVIVLLCHFNQNLIAMN